MLMLSLSCGMLFIMSQVTGTTFTQSVTAECWVHQPQLQLLQWSSPLLG